MVVYDAQSHQLSVRDISSDGLQAADCPYCHRPLRDEFHSEGDADNNQGWPEVGGSEQPFMEPGYFGMLAASQRASPSSSTGPATPARRLFQPALRSGRSRNVSGAYDPHSGAEFVGSEPSDTAREGISTNAFSPGYFKQFFREIRELGRGGNGVVLLVEHIMDRVSLGQFACKRIPVGNDRSWLEKALVEVKLLQQIPNRNLVAYHWVWLEDYQPSHFGPSIPCLWILQEYCNGGDLHHYVLGPKADLDDKEKLKERVRRRSKAEGDLPLPDLRGPSKLSFEEIFAFFRDIASGLHHLHTKGYIHRDLKPSNCLIQCDGSKRRVLISDFGEVQAAGSKRGSTGATGTISYCAPEVLQRNPTDGTFGDFTTKSDVFSLGMIVYFMCFGRLPYSNADDINEEHEDLDELRKEITKWPGFDDEVRARPDLPEKLYRYLKRLLSVDANERPSTEEILASIRAGADLGDNISAAVVEENSSRISAIDSPRHRPSPQGRGSKSYISRPGLSSLPRHISHDDVQARSPTRRRSGSTSNQSPSSPTEGSVVRWPKHVDLPPSGPSRSRSKGHKSPQRSPLMLPPPPQPASITSRAITLLRHHHIVAMLRCTLFVAKLLSLTLPCAPFTPNPWLLYTYIIVAAAELGLLSFNLRRTALLLAVHVTALILASQHGRLCGGDIGRGLDGRWTWEDNEVPGGMSQGTGTTVND